MGGTFHTYTCHICLHGMFGLLQDVRLPSSSGSTQVNDKGHSAIPVSLCFHSDSYSHSVVPIPFRLGSHSGFVPVRFLFRLRPHLLLVLLAALLPVGFFHWISFFLFRRSVLFPVPLWFGSCSVSILVQFFFWFVRISIPFLFVSGSHSGSSSLLIPPFWFPIPIPFRFLFRFGSCIRVLVPDPFRFSFISFPFQFISVWSQFSFRFSFQFDSSVLAVVPLQFLFWLDSRSIPVRHWFHSGFFGFPCSIPVSNISVPCWFLVSFRFVSYSVCMNSARFHSGSVSIPVSFPFHSFSISVHSGSIPVLIPVRFWVSFGQILILFQLDSGAVFPFRSFISVWFRFHSGSILISSGLISVLSLILCECGFSRTLVLLVLHSGCSSFVLVTVCWCFGFVGVRCGRRLLSWSNLIIM